MAYEHKENNGNLFKNKRKEKPKQPDYTGQVNVGGTLYNISAWTNESKSSGERYFGLQVSIPKPKDDKPIDPQDLPF